MTKKIKGILFRILVATGFYAVITEFAKFISADGKGVSFEWGLFATIIFLFFLNDEMRQL